MDEVRHFGGMLMWVAIMAIVGQANYTVVIVGGFCDCLCQLSALIKYNGCPLDMRCGMRCTTWDGFWGYPLDGGMQNEMRHMEWLQGKKMIILVDIVAITRLPFGEWSVVFDDRMRTLDHPGLRASLRAFIGVEPTISDQRVRYESIYAHYQEMRQKWVAEMDVDVLAHAYLFYLLSTTLFTNHGNDADLALLPSLQDLDATRQLN
ncbi:hypothetical protein JCGZ_03922 [Jatropha curcas]|uniref:Aminotransferase-like plant mobile domain-containing protein n=1 Tax=Jatropha curcas TaxID=180498 RepID=A0A067LR75_JATCU|nr:hypothetical protein JCGZ_03922 [Jatropha curcas]